MFTQVFTLCIITFLIDPVFSNNLELSQVFWDPLSLKRSEIRHKRALIPQTLIKNPRCKDDLRRLCINLDIRSDDLSVLECIQTAKVGIIVLNSISHLV